MRNEKRKYSRTNLIFTDKEFHSLSQDELNYFGVSTGENWLTLWAISEIEIEIALFLFELRGLNPLVYESTLLDAVCADPDRVYASVETLSIGEIRLAGLR